jgi:hypothetical protein
MDDMDDILVDSIMDDSNIATHVGSDDNDFADDSDVLTNSDRKRCLLVASAAVADYHNLVLQDSFNTTQFIQQLSSISRLFKQPYHTCPFRGIDWVDDLLHPDSHPERIRAALGVHHHVFHGLLKVLQKLRIWDSRHVLLREQLAIFLHGCVKGLSVTDLCERFQRSADTITKWVLTVLFIFSRLC